MSKNVWEDETPGKVYLKQVWKFYALAFGGLGLVWLGQKVAAPLSTVLAVVGFVCFLLGVYLTLYWDRKRKEKLEGKDKDKK